MRHQRAQGHGVVSELKDMTYAVILVKVKPDQPRLDHRSRLR